MGFLGREGGLTIPEARTFLMLGCYLGWLLVMMVTKQCTDQLLGSSYERSPCLQQNKEGCYLLYLYS